MKLSAFRKGLTVSGFDPEEIEKLCQQVIMKGTVENDEAPPAAPASSAVALLDAAGAAWMGKAAKPAAEPDGDEGDEDEDDEDGAEDEGDEYDDDEPMGKGASFDDAAALAVISKAVSDAVGAHFVRINKALALLGERVQTVGSMHHAQVVAHSELIAKADTRRGEAALESALAEFKAEFKAGVEKLEKAQARVEEILKVPTGGFTGIYDAKNYEPIPAPGDGNAPPQASTINKADTIQGLLLKAQREARESGDSARANRLSDAIGDINRFPSRAATIAAEHGITI